MSTPAATNLESFPLRCDLRPRFESSHSSPRESTDENLHGQTSKDNVEPHIKREITGREVVVAITTGKHTSGQNQSHSAISLRKMSSCR